MPDRRRLILAVVTTLAVLGLLGVRAADEVTAAARRIAVVIDFETPVTITKVTRDGPADRAGIQAGDRLISVDGAPIGSEDDYDVTAEHFMRGRPATFVVERDGARLELDLRPGTGLAWGRLLRSSGTALGYLLVALLALVERGGDRRARLLYLYAFAVAVELALPAFFAVGQQFALASSVLYYLLGGLQIGLELELVLLIPARPSWLQRRGWLVPAIYAVGVGAGLLGAATELLEAAGLAILPWSSSAAPWFADTIVLPLWSLAVTGLLTAQILSHHDWLGRYQAGLVLAGEIPWMVYNVLTAGVVLTGGQYPAWAALAEPFVLLSFPVAMFVAVFRYHLFDIERAVRRGLVYATLTGGLLLGFYAAVGAGSALLSQRVHGGVSVAAVSFATLLLGLAFSPLRVTLQRLIDRKFFPERSEQRRRLIALAAELPAYGKVGAMGRHLVVNLADIFAATSATLLVADPRSQVLVTVASTSHSPEREFDHSFLLSPDDPGVAALHRGGRPLAADQLRTSSASLAQRMHVFGAELAAPVTVGGELIGLLLLGPKAAGRYLAEEVELLSLVCHHVASVFENARLFDSATYDGLTGLLRRERILEHAERELQRALRYRRPLAIGIADLDHFKEVNDTYGHLVGDAVLKRVAQALLSALRSADAVGRWGGEEFLVVLPETELDGARRVAEKIRAGVEAIALPVEDGRVVRVTISIGLATLDGEREAEDLVGLADSRLYEAKQSGRNRIVPEAMTRVSS